ncbi:MAG: glycosyl hydrolase 108 family protein [Janthinobacterium lividum]
MSKNGPVYANKVVGVEGGYSNSPADSGGETIFGVTAVVARANGYNGAMKDMTRGAALDIFSKQYFVQPMFDQIDDMIPSLGWPMFQLGINMGSGTVGEFLQRSLNVLNYADAKSPKPWHDLTIDGNTGAVTRLALAAFVKQRGKLAAPTIVGMVRALASVRYITLAEAAPKDEQFEYGWQINRALEIS